MTTLIRGVGGGHIYTLSKMHYLERLGYDTLFFHANDTTDIIRIEELKQFEKCYDNHFYFPSYFFKEKEQNKVVERLIKEYIPTADEYKTIIIESQTTVVSTWGEVLSKKLCAKHLVYLLDEHPRISNSLMFSFNDFKLKRHELAGIGKNSLSEMFSPWQVLKDNERYYLKAHTPKPLANLDFDINDIPSGDYIIGSITRLEKKFLYPALEVVKQFAEDHANKTIVILIIGGEIGTNKNEKAIRQLFKNTANVKVVITGIIYPLPVKLVKIPHVFLSTSGACLSSIQLGKVTIPFDIHDGKPMGISKYTTNEILFREKGKTEPNLYDLLTDVLINKTYPETDVLYNGEEIVNYDDHMTFVEEYQEEAQYFEFDYGMLDEKQKRNARMVRLFGPKASQLLYKNLVPRVYKLFRH